MAQAQATGIRREPGDRHGHRRPGFAIGLLAVLVLLSGLALALGGAWLAIEGGSWYYLLAGLGLLVAGVLLWRGAPDGVWIYWGVLVGTVIWAAWESGLDYWRWVPRLDWVLLLGIGVALAWPVLDPRRSRRLGRGLALAFAAVFVVAFALAFAPHGWTRGGPVSPPLAAASALAGSQPLADAGGGQPANAPAASDWTAYGGSQAALRFSALNQITPENAGRLRRLWVHRTGEEPERRWGAQTTPLKVGDTLYLCTGMNQLIALDAATGEERWRHDPKVPETSIPYTAACRGVTYYVAGGAMADAPGAAAAPEAGVRAGAVEPPAPAAADATPVAPTTPDPSDAPSSAACATRIIEGTLDGRLIAVDARDGRPCQGFGEGGSVDIKRGMGEVPEGFVSITSPPVVVRDVIVTGHQVLDGQRRMAPSGVIQGFDAVTGELRWAWDMVRPDRRGLPPEGETYTRGTPNMWTTASADEDLGLVFLPMGNSAADYWSSSRRPEENAYSTALVALDAVTGQPRWHFQTVHVDVWDYDLGSQATLIDFPRADGTRVPAVLLPSKQGDLYVLDRRTGEPLTPVEQRPAPQGGVEPDRRTPTQPHSGWHTLRKPDLTARDMWGLTPFDQLACRIQFQRASYQGIYTPPSADRRFVQYPGYNGGSDWGSVAVDPQRGVIVANYNDMPNYNRLVPREEADRLGWAPRDEARGGSMSSGHEGAGDPQQGTPYAIDVNAGWRLPFTQLLCKEPPYGGIRAIDLGTGETLWDRPLGSGRRNGPFGIPSMLPVEIGTPNNGGPVVTAGGLVFIAATTDNLIRAIDLSTGKTVWSDVLPAGGQATPMVYEQGGRQVLVIMAGGHHFMETPVGDHVIAYALDE